MLSALTRRAVMIDTRCQLSVAFIDAAKALARIGQR